MKMKERTGHNSNDSGQTGVCFKKRVNPSRSFGNPSMAFRILDTQHLPGVWEKRLNRYNERNRTNSMMRFSIAKKSSIFIHFVKKTIAVIRGSFWKLGPVCHFLNGSCHGMKVAKKRNRKKQVSITDIKPLCYGTVDFPL